MSNQEAIALLRNLEDSLDSYCGLNEEGKTAFRMAIEALNSSEIPNSSDTISRQQAIDALDVLCQEHRYKIPGKGETYSQYNEAWQDALDRAEGAIFNLPSAQPEPLKIDLSGYSEEDWERLKKEWGNTPITVLSAQPDIVRCRDCRYYNSEEKECLDLLGHGRRWEEDDYCSYAER